MARPKIGLVLGGGGNRGLAHVGVLKILERENIPIDYIVGTSMGGIIAILYTLGMPPDEMTKSLVASMEGNTILSMNVFSARSRQRAIRNQLIDFVGEKTFADLDRPVTLMAVDMVSGREVELCNGMLMPALLASSAVPAVFPPVEIDGMQLADGGVIDSLSTHVAYKMGAERVIAVDIYPALETQNPWPDPISDIVGIDWPFNFSLNGDSKRIPSSFAAIWRSVRVITWHTHQQRLRENPPDVLLRPDVGGFGSLDFKDMEGPLQAGIEVAEAQLDALRGLLQTA